VSNTERAGNVQGPIVGSNRHWLSEAKRKLKKLKEKLKAKRAKRKERKKARGKKKDGKKKEGEGALENKIWQPPLPSP
jgi:sRNA-binding protein